jgi:hypothetical protein
MFIPWLCEVYGTLPILVDIVSSPVVFVSPYIKAFLGIAQKEYGLVPCHK